MMKLRLHNQAHSSQLVNIVLRYRERAVFQIKDVSIWVKRVSVGEGLAAHDLKHPGSSPANDYFTFVHCWMIANESG